MNYFRKSLKIMLLVSIIMVSVFKLDTSAQKVPVYLDNQKIELSNDVFIENGRVMVPLREICEKLGYDVQWDEESRRINIGRTDSFFYLVLWIDSCEVRNWGGEELDIAPKIIDGRTYIPLRTLTELLGASITWDENSKSVHMHQKYSSIQSYSYNVDQFSLFVPQIINPVDGEIKINEYFKNKLTTELDFLEAKNIEALGELWGEFKYEIKNNKNNILSIFERRDMGIGAMGMSQFKQDHYSCDTFYKNTGERLKIEDILKGSKEDIEKIIISAYEKYDGKIQSAGTSLHEYEKCDNNHLLNNYDFYIEDNDLVFVVNVPSPWYPPFKVWIAIFKLNINDNANLFQEDFLKNFNKKDVVDVSQIEDGDSDEDSTKNDRLFNAVSVGNLEKVKELIKNGADVNARYFIGGMTPLHLAEDVEMAKLLIENGADVNAKNNDGETPLYSKVFYGNVEMAKLLIENGADVNVKGGWLVEETPLHNVRDIEIAKLLIENGADVNAKTDGNSTPLHDVKNAEIARLLIENGADVNAKTSWGTTPLYETYDPEIARVLIENGAVFNSDEKNNELFIGVILGDVEKVKVSIENGADVNAEGETFESFKIAWHEKPLHYVENAEIAKLLIESGADVNARSSNGETPLHKAKDVEIAKLLIENGADVNARSRSNSTPLHDARNAKIAKLLIENGADVNARGNDRETPLHKAKDIEIAKLLIENGADVNAKGDWAEKTPLYKAKDVEIARLLIENGADVNVRDNDGDTPLYWAAYYGNVEIAKLLIENGADVNARNDDGEAPLHTVRSEQVAKLLIENGADVNVRDNNGRTPLHMLYWYINNAEVMRLLVENGADVNVRDNNGRTPLHIAQLCMHFDIAEMLIENGADPDAIDNDGNKPCDLVDVLKEL